jgi:hypothetical protein
MSETDDDLIKHYQAVPQRYVLGSYGPDDFKPGTLLSVQGLDGVLRTEVVKHFDPGPPCTFEFESDPDVIKQARAHKLVEGIGTVIDGLIDSEPSDV